jgi:hypothetical protein
MSPKTRKALIGWMKQPNSWLALTASIISFATFYLVYADRGRVELILPDRIGIQYDVSSDVVEMLLPLTFTNTGAPRTQRHILRVTALVSPAQPPAPGNTNPSLAWEYEKVFIGEVEWIKKYPDRNSNTRDYVDYLGRAFAFALHGGESKFKLLDMMQSQGKLAGRSLNDFTLTAEVLLDTGSAKAVQRYSCTDTLVSTSFKWCKLMGQ